MLHAYAGGYARMAHVLQEMQGNLYALQLINKNFGDQMASIVMARDNADLERLRNNVYELIRIAEDNPPIKRMLPQLRRFGLSIQDAVMIDDIKVSLRNLQERFFDELGQEKYLAVSADLAAIYENETPFGDPVAAAFPDANDDIVEAAKCLALGRNKASVCHIMLAMEVALRLVAAKLSATVQDKNDRWLPWLTIANSMDTIITKMPEGEPKEKWWEVQTMLKSVGKAWRNPTMHPAKTYDAEQAKKVFENVRDFMGDLAALA